MAIISASRRTDIPAFYSEWFIRRLEEGSLMVRNPYVPSQVSIIPLNKETIDCIVFWTKNPIPMLDKMHRIPYPFYTQFTLTGYGKDIEPNLPDKTDLLKAFKELSKRTAGRVIWRYDPIIITREYPMMWHIEQFAYLASSLKGYTDKCVISFVDTFDWNKDALGKIGNKEVTPNGMPSAEFNKFCKALADIAHKQGMEIASCAEKYNLDRLGITHNRCIDPDYIEKITGFPIKSTKDGAQREACGCIESVEIGSYNTCHNGCKYCYACKDASLLCESKAKYDVDSPLLCDSLNGTERVTERKLKSMIDYKAYANVNQISFF